MGASLPVMVSLSIGDEATVVEGPCVLTDLILTEISGGAPACVVLMSAADAAPLMTLCVAASQTICWHGSLAIGSGIRLTASLGDMAVTVGYC